MQSLEIRSPDNWLAVANLPTNMLCSLVQQARLMGVKYEAWFAGLRLQVADIHDPSARVSYRQASEIIHRALRSLPVADLGLLLGRQQNGGNFGLLGLAMKTAPNFAEAVSIGLEFQRNQGPLMDLTLLHAPGQPVTVVATAMVELPEILPFLCEEMFASLLMLARELAGATFRPQRVDLSYPAPTHQASYMEVFECEVRFNQPRNAMLVDESWLSLPFPSYNPVTSQHALAMCRAQLAANAPLGETTAAVERFLRPRLQGNPQMLDAATSQHLSERTLRRQLANEGTSFSAIHDRIRTERALELLNDRSQSIAQVGMLVGFTDAREFRRAFKRWTGFTPSQARARQA